MSNRTLPVAITEIYPIIYNMIATIGGTSETLLTPVTKEVVAVAASGSACIHWTPRQVSRAGVNRSTPGNTGLAVRPKPAHSPVLIGIPTISPDFGQRMSLQVGKKQNPLPLTKSGMPKNWTQSLMKICPMIKILRPFLAR